MSNQFPPRKYFTADYDYAARLLGKVCPTCSAVDSIAADGRCAAFGTGCGYVRPGSVAARALAIAERVARGEYGCAFDTDDGWCHVHRAHCSMAPVSL